MAAACSVPQITPSDFALALFANKSPTPAFPIAASLDLTSACNLRCLHCFLRYENVNVQNRSTAEVLDLMLKLRDLGVLFLVLTGGEPLSRPDFPEIYRHAKRCGFFVMLFSNGTLMTESIMDLLAELPPRRIELTAYGHTEQTYEAVTGIPGSFRRFRAAVDGLLRRKLVVRLKSMVLRTNVHEWEAIRDWATELGCEFQYDAIVHPCINGDRRPLAERLTPDQIAQFRHQDRDRSEDPGPVPPGGRKFLFGCGAGLLTVHIDSRHQGHPCMNWRIDPFDLTAPDILPRWGAYVDAIRSRTAPGGRCDTCENRLRCQACVAHCLLETGNAAGTPTFFCQVVEAEKHLAKPA